MRLIALALVLLSSAAFAEPFQVSLNFTIGGRWLEGLKVSANRDTVALDGSVIAMGGTVDLVRRLGIVRVGGQAGAEVMLFPRDLSVLRSEPLNRLAESDEEVSSLLFLGAAPLVGVGAGDEHRPFEGWADFLLALELVSARVERERHYGFVAVPTIRLGGAVRIGSAGIELSVLASYFGTPRLTLAMGVRF